MNEAEIRKKVLLDIFAAPASLAPIVLGSTIGLIGWAGELSVYCIFSGMAGILVGVGVMLTKLIFNVEGLTEKAFNDWKNQAEDEFERKLDELAENLKKTDVAKDENFLRDLRQSFKTYKGHIKEEKIPNNLEVSEKLIKLFNGCIEQLNESYTLWESTLSMSGNLKKETLKHRSHILEDIDMAVDSFSKTVRELIELKKEKEDLSALTKELGNSVDVAKKTEERLANLYLSK
jgi:hypothetical protein